LKERERERERHRETERETEREKREVNGRSRNDAFGCVWNFILFLSPKNEGEGKKKNEKKNTHVDCTHVLNSASIVSSFEIKNNK